MDILGVILQVVGGIVVALVALLVAARYAFRWWLRRKLGDAFKMVGQQDYGNPPRITLRRFHGDWHHEAEVTGLKSQAEQLGYMPIDRYTVEEMPDIFLWALFNPGDATCVVVYDHPMAGAFFDVVTHYPDGTGATVSNGKGPTLDPPPGELVLKDPALTLRQARDKLLEVRKPGPYRPIDPDNFVEDFQAAYARQMDHVIGKGEISEEYMRESGKTFGITHQYTDEEYAKGREMQREQLRQRAAEACLANFLATTKLTPAQWEACRDRTLVIHERLSVDEVVQEFCAYLADMDQMDPRIVAARQRHAEALALFESLNALLGPKSSYLQLGEVETPVRAHVYLAPR